MTQASQTDVKRAIMDRIQTRVIDAPPLPEIDVSQLIQFSDPLSQFGEMLKLVGGDLHQVSSEADIEERLREIDTFRNAENIVSLVPSLGLGNVDAENCPDPHLFANVDWTIAAGEFMVAENGAIWVDGKSLPHRVLIFIAQYLAIVVPRGAIVNNMHEAYDRLSHFDSRFGVFVSGPSKTADIEQSLVLGAHGCRRLQVFVVD